MDICVLMIDDGHRMQISLEIIMTNESNGAS